MPSFAPRDPTRLCLSAVLYHSESECPCEDDLPILLAGKGRGSIKSGRHIRYQNGTPLTNLFLCMLDRMGVHADTLGDSSGRLEQLI